MRPHSSDGSFDKKWRFITQKQVSPIDLAICWDMRPEDPTDEPKRPTHIDGSNGSAAPAVFTMVKSPKDNTPQQSRRSSVPCDGIHGCGTPVPSCDKMTALEKIEYARGYTPQQRTIKNRPITCQEQRRKSASTDSLYVNMTKNRKLSQDTLNTQSTPPTVLLKRQHMHKSTPNLSVDNSCSSNCSQNGFKKLVSRECHKELVAPLQLDVRPRSEYKMAFKAGVPRRQDSVNSSSTKTTVKVPKQREPYAKRNYEINSLSPPFSMWKGTSVHSYPEHWRLASVYQHSYKPVEARKCPLLASVYQ